MHTYTLPGEKGYQLMTFRVTDKMQGGGGRGKINKDMNERTEGKSYQYRYLHT
jgi:hypothetical protein